MPLNKVAEAVVVFAAEVQELHRAYYTTHYTRVPVPQIELKFGRKYAKLLAGSSVFAFVDLTNGDVLKPAGWAAPAKHARGNVLSDQNGLEAITPGMPFVKYLR